MQVRVQRTQPIVGHQNFHLAHGKVLDVFLVGTRLADFRLAAEANLFILLLKKPRLLNRQSAPLARDTG